MADHNEPIPSGYFYPKPSIIELLTGPDKVLRRAMGEGFEPSWATQQTIRRWELDEELGVHHRVKGHTVHSLYQALVKLDLVSPGSSPNEEPWLPFIRTHFWNTSQFNTEKERQACSPRANEEKPTGPRFIGPRTRVWVKIPVPRFAEYSSTDQASILTVIREAAGIEPDWLMSGHNREDLDGVGLPLERAIRVQYLSDLGALHRKFPTHLPARPPSKNTLFLSTSPHWWTIHQGSIAVLRFGGDTARNDFRRDLYLSLEASIREIGEEPKMSMVDLGVYPTDEGPGGHEKARILGRLLAADVVVWGSVINRGQVQKVVPRVTVTRHEDVPLDWRGDYDQPPLDASFFELPEALLSMPGTVSGLAIATWHHNSNRFDKSVQVLSNLLASVAEPVAGEMRYHIQTLMALSLISARRHDRAIAVLDEAIDESPDRSRAFFLRGYARLQVGARTEGLTVYEKSIADLERSRELSPDRGEIAPHLSAAYTIAARCVLRDFVLSQQDAPTLRRIQEEKLDPFAFLKKENLRPVSVYGRLLDKALRYYQLSSSLAPSNAPWLPKAGLDQAYAYVVFGETENALRQLTEIEAEVVGLADESLATRHYGMKLSCLMRLNDVDALNACLKDVMIRQVFGALSVLGGIPDLADVVNKEALVEAFPTAVFDSVESGSATPWITDVLIALGFDPLRTPAGCAETALHLVATKGDVAMTQHLLGIGVGVNIPDDQGQTALHHSAGLGHVTVMKLLLDAGADIDASAHAHRWFASKSTGAADSPIACAIQQKQVDAAKHLLSEGCTVPELALHMCFSAEVGRLLIQHGVHPDVRDGSFKTPLHWQTSSEMVDLLLDEGADVNARDADGFTP